MKTSDFIFGCEQLGGYQWGNYDIKLVEKSVEYALSNRINEFDTADCYGLGLSEKRLGKILSKYNRSDSLINTKFGVRFNSKGVRYIDNNPKWINIAIDKSLERLNTDYIDLYLMHEWDNETDLDIVFENLENLKSIGKIKNYGVSNLRYKIYKKYLNNNVNSLSVEFSYICNDFINDIEKYINRNIRFLPYGVLAQGLLSGKYKNNKFDNNDRRFNAKYRNFHGNKFLQNLKRVENLIQISESLNVCPAAMAVYYAKTCFHNTTPIVGIKNVEQIKSILQIRNIQKNPFKGYAI